MTPFAAALQKGRSYGATRYYFEGRATSHVSTATERAVRWSEYAWSVGRCIAVTRWLPALRRAAANASFAGASPSSEVIIRAGRALSAPALAGKLHSDAWAIVSRARPSGVHPASGAMPSAAYPVDNALRATGLGKCRRQWLRHVCAHVCRRDEPECQNRWIGRGPLYSHEAAHAMANDNHARGIQPQEFGGCGLSQVGDCSGGVFDGVRERKSPGLPQAPR